MVKNVKRYIGSFSTEILAAKAYDKAAIINHPNRNITNFKYTKKQKKAIINENEFNYQD